MRGLISLAMLAELERYSGRPIYEQVDMIAGTSTGALMAAGFAVGMSAERILNEIYREALPRAFGRRGLGFWLRFLLRGTRHMYSLDHSRASSRPMWPTYASAISKRRSCC